MPETRLAPKISGGIEIFCGRVFPMLTLTQPFHFWKPILILPQALPEIVRKVPPAPLYNSQPSSQKCQFPLRI